jgi:hypothetical protein
MSKTIRVERSWGNANAYSYVKPIIFYPEVVLNAVFSAAVYYVATDVSTTVEVALPHNSEWRSSSKNFDIS